MNSNRCPRIIALMAFYCLAGAASGQSPQSPDGLVKVKPRQMELAWLLPGADFRPYTKVIIDRTQVAFRENLLKDYNLSAGLGKRVSEEQAARILAAAQTNFDEVFSDAFRKAGYEVVTTNGPDVLRVNSAILVLALNAPLGQGAGHTSLISTAGKAALIVEVRDSITNALLGRIADGRETQDLGPHIATTATNIYDSRSLFTLWAGTCVKSLGELKSVSPVPKDLTPNQSL